MSCSGSTSQVNEEPRPAGPPPKASLKYHQRYSILWEASPLYKGWLTVSKKGSLYAFCKLCGSDILVKAGKTQLDKHAKSKKHIDSCKTLLRQPTINSLPSVQLCNGLATKVKDAEIRLAAFVVEHNLPFNVMEHLPALLKATCVDSEVAKGLACSRTKTTAMVKNVLGAESKHLLIEEMKTTYFSLIVDESTDVSCMKHVCIVVRLAAKNLTAVKDKFFALLEVTDATADGLFNLITASMDKHDIPWRSRMVGFGADGANTMMGRHHSLQSLFREQIPNLFVMKCICHSFHLCASNACLKLPRKIEDFTRNVYNYLSNSPKRQSLLKEFQSFVGVKPHKILHPAQTRWLSLRQVVDRLLEQYDALHLFFIDAVANDRLLMAEEILKNFRDPQTKLFLEFLSFALPIFTNLNALMQSEEPQIHKLYDNVSVVLKTLMECYLKRDSFRQQHLKDIQYKNPHNYLPLEQMYFGARVTATLNNAELDPHLVHNFQMRCLDFMIEGVDQIYQRIPLQDTVLQNLSFLNPDKVESLPSLAHIASSFPNIISLDEIQNLDTEWRMLKNSEFSSNEMDAFEFWKKVCRQTQAFPTLIKFVSAIFSLPHSSANVERIFSAINNLKPDKRNRLSTQTLNGCLHAKRILEGDCCFNFSISNSLRSRMNGNLYDPDLN